MAGVTEKKGIFSRCTDHDDQTAFEQRQEKILFGLSRRWISSKSRTKPPENLASSAISWRRFLLSTVALKVRKAYLVVPAMAEAILVLPNPRRSKENHGGQTIGLHHAADDFACSDQVLLTNDLIDGLGRIREARLSGMSFSFLALSPFKEAVFMVRL